MQVEQRCIWCGQVSRCGAVQAGVSLNERMEMSLVAFPSKLLNTLLYSCCRVLNHVSHAGDVGFVSTQLVSDQHFDAALTTSLCLVDVTNLYRDSCPLRVLTTVGMADQNRCKQLESLLAAFQNPHAMPIPELADFLRLVRTCIL